MGEIAARLSDIVIVTSDNPRTEDAQAIVDQVETGIERTGLEKIHVAGIETTRGYCVEIDRREGIRIAVSAANSGDVVLIAGKGNEDYQILGTAKINFDDREVAREALRRRANA